MGLHSFLLQQLSTATAEPARSLCDHIKWHFWKRTSTRKWRLWKEKWELKYSHSSQKSTMHIPHFHGWNLSFDPTTPLNTAEQYPEHSPRRFRSCSPVCCHLVFTNSDDESLARTSDPHLWHHSNQITAHSREEQNLLHHSYITWVTTIHLHQAQMTPPRMLQPKKKIFPQLH